MRSRGPIFCTLLIAVLSTVNLFADPPRINWRQPTDLELQRLIEKEGVFEEGKNYNVKINGYGTGLRPPTLGQWNQLRQLPIIVEHIDFGEAISAPPGYDNSVTPWFPPIGNQDGEGSCVSWAAGYYTKTFQEAQEHGWDLSGALWEGGYSGAPSSAYQDRIFSPDFIYHQVNDGDDNGSYYSDNINLLYRIGCCTWDHMPYDAVDHTTWPSEAAWRQAPWYRSATGYGYLWVDDDPGIEALKDFISTGNLAIISVNADEYPNLNAEDLWTSDLYSGDTTNHANTVVGYDDNFGPYNESGNPDTYGAFKVANSWGVGFTGEKTADGFYFISYNCMKLRVESVFLYDNLVGYEPAMVAVFSVDHALRGENDLSLGIGDPIAPEAIKRFDDYNYNGGDWPYPSHPMVVDITEFGAYMSGPPDQFFLGFHDGGTAATGTIQSFAIEEYDDYASGLPTAVYTSADPPLSTIDGNYVYASLWTSDLPPIDLNLTASVMGDNLLLEWNALPDVTEFNVYRDTVCDFVADRENGTNRIAERIVDEDPGTPGVQWTDTGNGSDIVGDVSTNYYYRVTALVPAQSAAFAARAMRRQNALDVGGNGDTPHFGYINISNSDGPVFDNGDLRFKALILQRPGEMMTEMSTGSGYNSGMWLVGAGDSPAKREVGELSQREATDAVDGEIGWMSVVMTSGGCDRTADMLLQTEVESDPSNVAGEFDYQLITTMGTDINVLLVLFDTGATRQPIRTAEELCQAIPNCTDVYYWEATGQGTVGHVGGLAFNNFAIHPHYPYFVNVTEPTVWAVAGEYRDTTFQLITTSGTDINHLGVPCIKKHLSTAEALGSDIPNCTDVYYWDAPGQGTVGHVVGLAFNDFSVYFGHAYYVNVTDAGVWPEMPGGSLLTSSLSKMNTEAAIQKGMTGGGIPHMVYGRWSIAADVEKTECQLNIRAWIKGREHEVLTMQDVGVGCDEENWWVAVNNLPTNWNPGDELIVQLSDQKRDLMGESRVVLTDAGSDDGGEIVLSVDLAMCVVDESPAHHFLSPNYPNPFNPETTIRFGLSKSDYTKITIYDISGRLVRTLVAGKLAGGNHRVIWNGRNETGQLVSSGVYLVIMESGEFRDTIKCLFTK